ncbi:MAG: extracellular solute-binding protein [Firmicutes bacterium]|nr:extracellular solute-binding protein [Bacillota bacterium]MBR6404897.1 extracellular solute-binding protein [Lachnospiraceae bacterium]
MRKLLALLVASILAVSLLAGCSGGGKVKDDGVIRVWVGEESAEFYQKICDEYIAAHADFGYKIEVKGMDTGSVAGTITNDPTAAADIYTVAHDNIGKLASTQCAKPIVDESLVSQVLADNPESFQTVIYSTLNGKEYLYGVPYISQALFLYYNKALVTEEQAKTFEGLQEAAKAANTKAITVTGDDGFNMSFALLARKVSDKSTTVKLFEGAESVSGGSKGKSNCQGDDTVAIVRWLQDFASDPNGFKWASPDGWEADLNKDNKGALAVIGGAWHYNSAKAALGETNLGITLIPTFKLTDRAVEGLSTVKAGDEYRGGTFADCKCFMINANSAVSKYAKEQELIKYLSSKDVQNKSYLEVLNVPAYVGAADYIKQCFEEGKVSESEYMLAASQVSMAEWGIPQPFITGTLNTYYYSKNGPAVFRAMIDKTAYPTTGDQILTETESLESIRKGLYLIEYLWMHGVTPSEFPAKLPEEA